MGFGEWIILLVLFTEIIILTALLLYFIIRFDEDNQLVISKGVKQVILGYSLFVSVWVWFFLGDWTDAAKLMIGIFAAYLLTASIIDYRTKQVHDFLHLIGAFPGIVIAVWQYSGGDRLLSLFLFVVLQVVFFMKMYGEADAFAFITCGLMEFSCGAGLLTYLLHMLIVFLLLGLVQVCRHNINKSGNLKKEVALVPYIAATVWFFLS